MPWSECDVAVGERCEFRREVGGWGGYTLLLDSLAKAPEPGTRHFNVLRQLIERQGDQ